MRRQLFLLIAVAPTLAVALTGPAGAADTGGSALALCTPGSFADMQKVAPGGFLYGETDRFGGYNWNNSESASVACGMVRLTTASPRVLTVNYANNTANSMQCAAHVLAWADGAVLWSSVKSAGTGTGFFLFTIPTSMVGYVAVQCYLPKTTNSLRAGVIGFNLQ